jgi:hypothetical protein
MVKNMWSGVIGLDCDWSSSMSVFLGHFFVLNLTFVK